MSQHDYIISNDTGANVRSDLNNALGAIATVNSGATEPTTTYAYQLWMDTANNVLKMRNSANSAWYTLPISPVANNTVDINGGTIDGATIATSDITVGAGKTLDVSAGTLTLANDQISGDAINGGTIGSVAITSADINGGTIDGVTIGGSSAGAGTFTNLTATGTVTLNQSTIDGLTVGQGAGNVATNTAVGKDALDANTTGGSNTAIGQDALGANTTASNNTAVGYEALYDNTTGSALTGVGNRALYENTTGQSNVAVGSSALRLNTSGDYNTAMGNDALRSNTTASYNIAVGYRAGYSNSTGTKNTIVGNDAGYDITTGGYNVCIGSDAGKQITTGSKNTIIGGYNGNQGGLDIRTSSNNIVLSDGDGNPRMYCNSSGLWSVPVAVQVYGRLILTTENDGALVSFFRATTNPSSQSNVAKIFASGTNLSTELRGIDASGNVTTLTPHNFELVGEPSEELAWAYYSFRENDDDSVKKEINADITKVIRLVENLTGEKLIYISRDGVDDGSTPSSNLIQSLLDRIEQLEADVATLKGN